MAIEVKFCTAKRTYVSVDPVKFDVNRCNESPLRGEKPDFWPVSKFNTGSLPLRGNPAGKKSITSKAMQYRRDLQRRVLIITMRSRLFSANSASDFLHFAKSRPQFCETCGATYRRICEKFNALQRTSAPCRKQRPNRCIIGDAILPQYGTK